MGLGAGWVWVCECVWVGAFVVLLLLFVFFFSLFFSTFLIKPLTGGSLLVFSDRCARDVTLLYLTCFRFMDSKFTVKFSSVHFS